MYTPDWNTVYNTQNTNVQTQNVEAQNALARARANASPGGFTTLGGASPNLTGTLVSPSTGTGTTGPGTTGGIPNISNLPVVSGGASGLRPGETQAQNISTTLGYNQSVSDQNAQQFSASYIPEYSQTPILEEIAKYSRDMAPKVYQWGMDQFNRNQGNIDTLMRNALSYASPQRIASNMGMAEAGVQQGAEAGRQSAIRDLQSFGIDPSSGRYAALDTANRVMAGASAAGAGNQQRMADIATGNTMQNQALAAGQQNIATGYGAANAANALLGTASNLKYSPLGTISGGTSGGGTQSFGYNVGSTSGYNAAQGYDPADAASISAQGNIEATREAHPTTQVQWGTTGFGGGQAPFHTVALKAAGGPIDETDGAMSDDDATTGGFVSQELSPSNGSQVDDVDARLNAGEFVVPKDVTAWKGQEFFYKLMAQARKMRATAGSNGGNDSPESPPQTGYAFGGPIRSDEGDERRPFPEDEAQVTPVLFAGEHAQTADRPALAQARTMLKQGFDLDDIGRRTGWDVGPNKRWMFEIPDDRSRINEGAIPKTAARPGQSPLSGPTVPLRDVLVHPALQAAYPKMFDTMRVGRASDPRDYGMYDPEVNALTLGQPRNAPKEDPRRVALHELTHGVQDQEDFQPGGSTDLFKQKGKLTPFDQYLRLKGEVEARNVADRMNLTPEERVAKRWWETSDVELKNQINHPYYRHGTTPTYDRLTKD